MNSVDIPMYKLNEKDEIKPNPIFHRPWDKLHSRCIEYPFAASHLGDAGCILDVGTVKSDPAWIAWLESLSRDIHATDYDPPDDSFENIDFVQSDVRSLPFEDNFFDAVLAVSVIEHIGLEDPQVELSELPPADQRGDVEAVRELTRVLKPEGKLVMTLPFGLVDGKILDGSARGYTESSLKRFNKVADIESLDYYEYQHASKKEHVEEYTKPVSLIKHITLSIKNRLGLDPSSLNETEAPDVIPSRPGRVTWRRIRIKEAQATHNGHTDGVVAGVWSPLS